jgi:hypothetical protein
MKRARLYAAVTICWVVSMPMGSTGCSFLLAKTVPPRYEMMTTVNCTEGKALPVSDLWWATYHASRLALVAALSPEAFDEATPSEIGLAVAPVILHIASAAYGHHVTSECWRAKDRTRLPASVRARLDAAARLSPAEHRDAT